MTSCAKMGSNGKEVQEPWQGLLWRLLQRKDFWQDVLTLNAYAGVGVTSLVWEVLSENMILPRMFLPELAQVVTVGQAGIIGLLAWTNPRVRQSLLGKVLLLMNVFGIGLHLKRIRISLQSGPAFQQALEKAGITNMQNPLVPMLAALMFPVLSFPGGKDITSETVEYASLENLDPELVAWEGRLPKVVKELNLKVLSRGRISRWMSLDVLRRPGLQPGAPCLMYIHGGAWLMGDRQFSARAFLEYIAAEHDIVVFTINYRLAPESRFPKQIHDCKRALAWVKRNAVAYGADPSKCFVAGESAGGHLTSLMALTANNRDYDPPEFTGDEDTSVVGAIDLYGVHDIVDSDGHHARNQNLLEEEKAGVVRLWERFVFDKILSENQHDFEAASPSHVVLKQQDKLDKLCPFLVIHGTKDALAAFDDSRTFFERLQTVRKATKSPVNDVFVQLDGADHAFGYLPSPRTVSMGLAVAAFIEHHKQAQSRL